MRYYYLGPWVYAEQFMQMSADPDDLVSTKMWGYEEPPNTIATIDLRSMPDQASILSNGVGFFVTTAPLGIDYYLLGNDLTDGLTLRQRNTWASLVGASSLDATNVRDALAENLTLKADPEGLTAIPPLTPDGRGNLKIYLLGHSKIWSVENVWPGHSLWGPAEGRLQEDYSKITDKMNKGFYDPDSNRKWLGSKLDKYRIPWDQWNILMPKADGPGGDRDVQLESPLRPTTTLTDNFNSYGNVDLDGAGPWKDRPAILQHKYIVVSNIVERSSAAGNPYRVAENTDDLSSDDMYAQALMVDTQDGGPATRVDWTGTQESCYFWEVRKSTTNKFSKITLGIWSGINLTGLGGQTSGQIYRLQSTDSQHELFNITTSEDLTAYTQTDTSFSGQLEAGFCTRTVGNSAQWDDWEAEDVVTSSVPLLGGLLASPLLGNVLVGG